MSSLGWIHFSKTYRDRVNTILDMMEDEGVVDELGLGGFRDAFANIFFPGISTIQTRAKYFFIVPYLIKDFINNPNHKHHSLTKYLDDEEHELMWKLAAKYKFRRSDGSGVIGITKRPRERISRSPSSIYWNGIRIFQFIKTDLSLSEYCLRINETIEGRLTRTFSLNSEISDDADIDLLDNHGIKVSTYKRNWRDNLDLPLTNDEADFFYQRIIEYHPDTLIGQITISKSLYNVFIQSDNFEVFSEIILTKKLSEDLKQIIRLAHDINEVVKGLHWVYCNEINMLFHKENKFLKNWKKWKVELNSKLIDIDNLKVEHLYKFAPRVNNYSIIFMDQVFEMIRHKKINYDKLSELVREQEQNVKGLKSRFRKGIEADIQKGEEKSLSYMNYRFSNAKNILRDIMNNLN